MAKNQCTNCFVKFEIGELPARWVYLSEALCSEILCDLCASEVSDLPAELDVWDPPPEDVVFTHRTFQVVHADIEARAQATIRAAS